MFEVIAAAVSALLGTVLGASITGFLSLRSKQVELHHARASERFQRDERWRETRRNAAARLLTDVDQLYDKGLEVYEAFRTGASQQKKQAAHAAHLSAWNAVAVGLADLQLAGPQDLSEQADKFRRAAGKYSSTLDDLVQTGQGLEAAGKQHDALMRARRDFVAMALTTLMPDEERSLRVHA
jgi:hypothetical protein